MGVCDFDLYRVDGRVVKLARAIADLAGEERVSTAHVAEALQYRPRVAES